MIDCHAHAFPDTGSWLERLVPAEQLDSVLEPARRITGPVSEHLSDASTAVNLTIETLEIKARGGRVRRSTRGTGSLPLQM